MPRRRRSRPEGPVGAARDDRSRRRFARDRSPAAVVSVAASGRWRSGRPGSELWRSTRRRRGSCRADGRLGQRRALDQAVLATRKWSCPARPMTAVFLGRFGAAGGRRAAVRFANGIEVEEVAGRAHQEVDRFPATGQSVAHAGGHRVRLGPDDLVAHDPAVLPARARRVRVRAASPSVALRSGHVASSCRPG